MNTQDSPHGLIERLVDDFPDSPRSRIEDLVAKGWSRTDPDTPAAHRIAVAERFARLALREND